MRFSRRGAKRPAAEQRPRHADLSAPLGGAVWEGGASTFINKGTNGRWRDVLTAEDIARYEATAERELGTECARWLGCATPALAAGVSAARS